MIYRQGATVGFYSFLALFPETQSAAVVLTNAIAMSDAAEWVARVLIEGLFDFADPTDYVKWSEEGKRHRIRQFEVMHNTLVKERVHGTKPLALEAYVGRDVNQNNDSMLEITLNPDPESDFIFAFQGLPSQRYQLRRYQNHKKRRDASTKRKGTAKKWHRRSGT